MLGWIIFAIIMAVGAIGEAIWIGWYARKNKRTPGVDVETLKAAQEKLCATEKELERVTQELENARKAWEEANKKLLAVQNEIGATLEDKNRALQDMQKAQLTYNKCQEQVKILTDNKTLLLNDMAAEKAAMAELIEAHKKMEMRAAEKELEHGEVLPLEEWEKDELKELEGIARKLRNPAPLYKALFEIYYAGALKRLVADTGASNKTGIYRLWVVAQFETENDGKISKEDKVLNYVGQSVNIGDRWAQHIKRGLGLDSIGTGIELYPAMKKYGIENFHFEVLEECEKSELGERETFWGNYYAVKEVGLNKKLG